MLCHSEPVTRAIVGKYVTYFANRTGKRWDGEVDETTGERLNGDEVTHKIITDWEKTAQLDASKKERESYFSLSSSVLKLLWMAGIFFSMMMTIILAFLDIPEYWVAMLFLPTGALFAASAGLNCEYKKSVEQESYIPVFDTAKLGLYCAIGVILGMVPTYFFAGVLFGA